MVRSSATAAICCVLAAVTILAHGCGGTDVTTVPPPPRVTVTSPKGGEVWYFGGVDRKITWKSLFYKGKVDIHYTTDTTGDPETWSWLEVALDVPDTGSHTWTIPPPASTTCRVRVRQTGDDGAVDVSDVDFIISPPALALDTPNGGEVWAAGSTQTISWTGGGFASLIIELSRDGNWIDADASPVEAIASSVNVTTATYAWVVTGPVSANCLVRVSEDGGALSDESDAGFTIWDGCLHVDDDAPAGGDGLFWSTAFSDIQDALAAAGPGTEIHVAGGIYKPTPGTDDTVSFVMLDGMKLHGGYAGDGAPDPDERDPATYVTVLSGDIGVVDDYGDNSQNVLIGASDATLDGLTVTRASSRGGLRNDSVTGLTVSNCAFTENQVSGMASFQSSLLVTNCLFAANSGNGEGGGIHNSETVFSITDCTFDSNVAGGGTGKGAGIHNTLSSGDITRCTFIGNDGRNVNDTSACWGGAIHNNETVFSIEDCVFDSNIAGGQSGHGAGMFNNASSGSVVRCTFTSNNVGTSSQYYSRGGGIANYDSSPLISECTFSDNMAYHGAGILNYNSSPVIVGCSFVGNYGTHSSAAGGGVYSELSSSPTIRDCSFIGNSVIGSSVTVAGGAVCFYHTSPSSSSISRCLFAGNTARLGGAFRADDADVSLTNCTFTGNEASGAGNAVSAVHSNVTVTNSILWDPAVPQDIWANWASPPTVSCSCVQGRHEGVGNFDADPGFVDPGYWDAGAWVNGDYHLSAGSPCIDRANGSSAPALDIEGLGRHDDPGLPNAGYGSVTYADIGAYEFQGTTSPAAAIGVTSPAGGYLWRIGDDGTLMWEATSDVSDVRIELSRDGGSNWEVIVASTPNTRRYDWTATDPGDGLTDLACIVRVVDAAGGGPTGDSQPFVLFSGRWYVSGAAPGGGDGFSWTSAFDGLDQAFASALPGHEVWIAEGTYKPTDTTDDKIAFQLPDGAFVYGGFFGTPGTEGDFASRDPVLQETVLSGDIGVGGDDTDNSLTVVLAGNDCLIDGLVVTGGRDGGMEASGYYSGMTWSKTDGLRVNGCVFRGNRSKGLYCYKSGSTEVSNCTFTGNGLQALYSYTCDQLLVTDSLFADNSNGISIAETDGVIDGCMFFRNIWTSDGAGLRSSSCHPLVTNCIFTGNVAENGGGLHGRYLGGPTIVNCVFTGNTATASGGGVYYDKVSGGGECRNSILYGNSSAFLETNDLSVNDSGVVVAYCCIGQGGYEGTDGNINANPLFVDADGPDNIIGTIDDNVRLQPLSSCIDAGDPATTLTEDITGDPRPQGSGYDMGAYEQ